MDWREALSPQAAEWFLTALGEPSLPQQEAWPLIAQGENVLVCAPTGTGKTLCAFLVCLDRLMQTPAAQRPAGPTVLYISPLKALGNDIHENLNRPLSGLAEAYAKSGREFDPILAAVRTGDTKAYDRQRMLKHPPNILITTPESLYLMLTSSGSRAILSGVKTVIVDEVHALLSNKRGTHLTLSLERLSEIATFSRIGLSATVNPPERAAAWLGGLFGDGKPRPVTIVKPQIRKRSDLRVSLSLPDLRSLPDGTIWSSICERVYNLVKQHKTTLVFANNRAVVEKIALGVNTLEAGIARAHHGSVSRETRLEAEQGLRDGSLRCMIATSSMELGIDVGHVDLVIQLGSPRIASRGLQRMGRAGHRPNEVSRMVVLPRNGADLLDSALVCESIAAGALEPMQIPECSLDVLAQQIVAEVCPRSLTIDELFAIATRAYPYRNLPKAELTAVAKMLRGDYDSGDRAPRPRVFFDEQSGLVYADDYSKMLARSGSTIPDRGLYPVLLPDGTKLGELDEEYVFEARVGDRFMLGSFPWQINLIRHDRVVVEPTSRKGARPPFWKGEDIGRSYETSVRIGGLLKSMEEAEQAGRLADLLRTAYQMDDEAVENLVRYIVEQMAATDVLPTHERILIEHFEDESGTNCLIHCVWGGRVNEAIELLLQDKLGGLDGGVQSTCDDNGILLHAMGEGVPDNPLLLLRDIDVGAAMARLLPPSPMFGMCFRYAAAAALMMGVRSGQRVPLWVQRLRGAKALEQAASSETQEHPLLLEAYRECLYRRMDIARASELIKSVTSGVTKVRIVRLNKPSPMAGPLQFAYEMNAVYDYNPLPNSAIAGKPLISPELLGIKTPDVPLTAVSPKKPTDADAMLRALIHDAGWTKADVEGAGCSALAEELCRAGRAALVGPLYVAAHEGASLASAINKGGEARARWTRRVVLARGPILLSELARRLGIDEDEMLIVLEEEQAQSRVVRLTRAGAEYWAHSDAYMNARRQQLRALRDEIRTAPPEAYASLLTSWHQVSGSSAQRVDAALRLMSGWALPTAHWEDIALPSRIAGYRPAWLDRAMQTGQWTWRVSEGKTAFYPLTEAQNEPLAEPEGLSDDEKAVYSRLLRQGASFPAALAASGVTGAKLGQVLQQLAWRGLVVNDSFAPMRVSQDDADSAKAPSAGASKRTKARSPSMRAQARRAADVMTDAGRWEAVGPPSPPMIDDLLERMFDRWAVISREAAVREGRSWPQLLERLRQMELQDTARRGYFVKGLSGTQFVRAAQFERIVAGLEAFEDRDPVCINALDPQQPYGHLLPHAVDSGFMCVQGTAVVLHNGRVALIVERHGGNVRFLPCAKGLGGKLAAALAQAFRDARIWPSRPRLTLSGVTAEHREAFLQAGFLADAQDLTLWK